MKCLGTIGIYDEEKSYYHERNKIIEWCTKHGCRPVSCLYMIIMEYYAILKIGMRIWETFWSWGQKKKKEGPSAFTV